MYRERISFASAQPWTRWMSTSSYWERSNTPIIPGAGAWGRIRHRKSCFSSSAVGALKAVICTPWGSTLPTTWRMIPPLPEVSIPCTISSTERPSPLPWWAA